LAAVEKNKRDLENIEVYKVRTYFEFKSPYLMKTVEEITLLNRGHEATEFTYTNLDNSGSGLHINYKTCWRFYDNDGSLLEYHNNSNQIVVYFPREKSFRHGYFRTIKSEYISFIQQDENLSIYIQVYFQKDSLVEIIMTDCDDYRLSVDYFISSPTPLDYNVYPKVGKPNTFFMIKYDLKQKSDGYIKLKINHKIPNSVLGWYQIGAVFGILLAIYLPFSCFLDSDFSHLITISSIGISLLVIIRSWIFKNQEGGTLVQFDRWYRVLVSILIFELFFVCLYHTEQCFIQGYNSYFWYFKVLFWCFHNTWLEFLRISSEILCRLIHCVLRG